jgi:hypothetical protein
MGKDLKDFWQRLQSGVEVAVAGHSSDRLLGIRDGFLRYFHDGLDRTVSVAVVPQPMEEPVHVGVGDRRASRQDCRPDLRRVLDAVLAQDPIGRVACETLVTTGLALVAGEITTSAYVDFQDVVRATINEIGYNAAKFGFDAATCAVLSAIRASRRTSPWAWTPAAPATRG